MDPAEWLNKQLKQASPDLLRKMLAATFVVRVMGAEVDGICAPGYGEQSPARLAIAPRASGTARPRPESPVADLPGARGSEAGDRGSGLAAERRSVRVRAAIDRNERTNHELFPTSR